MTLFELKEKLRAIGIEIDQDEDETDEFDYAVIKIDLDKERCKIIERVHKYYTETSI